MDNTPLTDADRLRMVAARCDKHDAENLEMVAVEVEERDVHIAQLEAAAAAASDRNRWKDRARRIHERWTAIGNVSRNPYDTTHVRFLALALCGEAGELANLIKKDWRGDDIEAEDIAGELADIRIYLEHLARALRVDLDAASTAKISEVERRLERVAAGVVEPPPARS